MAYQPGIADFHGPVHCLHGLRTVLLLVCCQAGAAFAQDNLPAPVSVVQATIAPVYEEIPLTGSVTSPRLSRISPRVGGLVSAVLVDAGDEVSQGDSVLQLDRVLAQIELSRSRAQLNEARARLKEAKRQRDETAELVKNKHIASTNYEASVAEVEFSSATVARLEAELEMQKEILARHTIHAPFGGIITDKLVEAGEWVDTRTALFELSSIDVLRVDIPVPQFYFNQVEIGTPVSIRFDSLPNRIFDEQISMKVPMGSASARTFPVRVDIQNTDRIIAPGMSARVRIMLKQRGQTMLLPRDAIVKKPDGSELIWVLNEEDGVSRAVSMQVQTGRSFRKNIEIVDSQLNISDKVVIRGNEILTPNQVVRIFEEVKLDL